MFADANKLAAEFTRPVHFTVERTDGSLGGGIGALVVINDEGWFVTAYHQIEEAQKLAKYQSDYQAYMAQVAAIENSREKMSEKERKKRIRRIEAPEKAVKKWAMMWGFDAQITKVSAIPTIDLAV